MSEIGIFLAKHLVDWRSESSRGLAVAQTPIGDCCWHWRRATTPSPSSTRRRCKSWLASLRPRSARDRRVRRRQTRLHFELRWSGQHAQYDLRGRSGGPKALPPIDLGALRSTHGLAFAGGKLYFTAETNKVIGRYDPATQRVEWILGTGQDRTHMVAVSRSLDRIVTSNVNSGTISIIEQVSQPNGGFGRRPAGRGPRRAAPPGRRGGPRLTWEVTNVRRWSWGGRLRRVARWKRNLGCQRARRDGDDHRCRREEGHADSSHRSEGRQPLEVHAGWQASLDLGSGRGQLATAAWWCSTRRVAKEVKQLSLGGGAAGILIAPDGSRAYVAVSTTDKIAVVDLKTWKSPEQIRQENSRTDWPGRVRRVI